LCHQRLNDRLHIRMGLKKQTANLTIIFRNSLAIGFKLPDFGVEKPVLPVYCAYLLSFLL
jgi:hypothetical protein